ncbi:MAG TPA: sigma factor, partial [Myxococcaceae bacterium]|nr:sigma factor [Myxococcaceae bacterium]
MSRAEAQLREEALLPGAGFEELVRAEQQQLLRIAWRFTQDPEEAQDLVQASLADAYERRHSLKDPALGAAWL